MRPLLLFWLTCAALLAADYVPDERTAVFASDKAPTLVGSVCIKVPDGITGYWTPSMSDLRGMEKGLPDFLKRVRPELAQWLSGKVQDDEVRWSWVRRWVAGVSKEDRRFIFVLYRCEFPAETAQREKEIKAKSEKMGKPYHPDRWKQSPPHVDGGGWMLFRVLFDIQERKFVWYEENFPE